MEAKSGSRLGQRLDILASISIIAVACLLFMVLVKDFVLPNRLEMPPRLKVGEKFPIPSAIVNSAGRVVVFALSTHCHFCSESAPFYRRVIDKKATKSDLDITAVSPQEKSEAAEYLKKLNLTVSDVKQVNFKDLRVPGTPAVILIDRGGVIGGVWFGKLLPEQENEILAGL